MEGVVFSLLDGLDLMRSMGLSIERVVASGGGTQHPLWLQLQADIFGAEVVKSETQEAAALGAALLAGIGVGVYSDFGAACEATVRYSRKSIGHVPPSARATVGRRRFTGDCIAPWRRSLAIWPTNLDLGNVADAASVA